MSNKIAASGVDVVLIARLNIEHYRKKLDRETDEPTRQILVRLLSLEEAKLKTLVRTHAPLSTA